MPRGSSAKRQQGAAATRDTRHENGLVGPGKRIVKNQRSGNNIRLDGSPRPQLSIQSQSHSLSSSSLDSAAPPPLPSPLPSTSSAPANVNGNGNGYPKHASNNTYTDDIMAADLSRRASVAAYSETSSSDSVSVSTNQAAAEDAHRRIDVNAAKNTNVHRDTGPFDLAFTVLRSCPLHDTIAILIILMQLSPFALSSIYTLFTLLTIVPPPTTSSGLSINEIFDGFGAPNLWTLVGLDIFFCILFAFMPLQDLILEFAQVVVAMTLGGGTSSGGGSTHNIFLCVGIILFNHFGQHQGFNKYSSEFKAMLGASWGTPDADDPLEPGPGGYQRSGPRGFLRSVLAIHVLVQGLVRYVRDWYLRRERRDLLSQSQSDPEAGKTPTLAVDPAMEGGLVPPDNDPNRQATSTAASNKKRKKQSHQVRIRQPLWAALASTKIVMVKEYELSHAASESAGSNATDIHNLGNAPFNTQPGQIWICYVGCDEVCFNTSHFPDPPPNEDDDENGNGKGPSYIDKTKPFYVRVNNAIWQPTRIIPVDIGEEEHALGTKWTGDIYGLTPMSNYECEFVCTRTGEVIFSTSIRTIPAKTKDADSAKAVPRSQYRHESPATTLRTSIAGLENKLGEEKTRLKQLRKDNNRKTNAVKKDIDRLTSAVQSAGGNDEKLKQKIAQNQTQQKQAEQAMEELQGQLRELGTIPEAVMAEYRSKQGEFQSEKGHFDQARTAFKSFKSSVEQQTKALDDEQTTLGAKRTKIAARLKKVDGEHARITDANARGLDEAERRRQETANFEAECGRRERELLDRYSALCLRNEKKKQEAAGLSFQVDSVIEALKQGMHATDPAAFYDRQDLTAYNPAAAQWPQYTQSSSVWSPSPAAAHPATTLPPGVSVNPLYAHHAFSQFQLPTSGPLRHKSRGRSSSMLSDISGFTQSTDEDDEVANSNGSKNASNGNLYAGTFKTGNSAINVNAPPFLPPIQTQSQSATPSPFAQYARPASGMRSPPGFPPGFPPVHKGWAARKGSGSASDRVSGSASGGSMHSANASREGSNKDPTSPV